MEQVGAVGRLWEGPCGLHRGCDSPPNKAPSEAALAANPGGEVAPLGSSTSPLPDPFPLLIRGRRKTRMDHDLEMQPHGAPGPGTSFSRGHLLGRPARPSKLPGGVSPLIPVLRKTIHLDACPQSHIPQAPGRLGLGARTRSVPLQDTGKSLVPRKLSSVSLTLRQHSHAWPLGPLPSHWEELSTSGTHGGGRLPTPGSPSVTRAPGGRVHSEDPGNPGLAKPSKMPTVEKPLVSSYLTLPFQARLAQSPPGPAGPGAGGQRHPVPATAHVPTRASPGRGKPRARGIPRPRLQLQRATPTTGSAMAMDLATPDPTRPGTARHLATAANRPGLAVNLATPNTSRLDMGTEFPDLDPKLGTATDLASAGTTKPGMVMDLVTSDPEKVSKAIPTAGTAKPDTTTGGPAMDLAVPDPVKLGTARPDRAMVLSRANTANLDITTNSLAMHTTSRLGRAMGSVVPVTPDPATGEIALDCVINLTTSDIAIYPSMLSRSPDPALDHVTADAATDLATEITMLDLARESRGKCQRWAGDVLDRRGGREVYAWDGLCLDRYGNGGETLRSELGKRGMGLRDRTQGIHPELGPHLPVRGQVEGSCQKER